MTTQTETNVQVGDRYAMKVGKHFSQVTVKHFLNDGGVEVETTSGKRMVVRDTGRLTPADDAGAAAGAPERTCYVCGKTARGAEKLLAVGQGFYRHKGCDPEDKAKGDDAKPQTTRKGGVLDAAAKVLADANEPMTAGEMIEKILNRGLWATKGKTPAATLYASILREMKKRGDEARFQKAGRGKFALRK